MRYLVLALVALVTQVSYADSSQFDSPLALGAARAYVESYLRWHPLNPSPTLEWDKVSTEFVPWKHGSFSGYVGVFVPDSTRGGCGVAVFDVHAEAPGHLFVAAWGYASDSVSDAKRRFESKASQGNPDFLP